VSACECISVLANNLNDPKTCTKLEGATDVLEGCHQEEPQQAGRNFMKFSKGKLIVVHPRLNNPIRLYRLGTDRRKNSFVKED